MQASLNWEQIYVSECKLRINLGESALKKMIFAACSNRLIKISLSNIIALHFVQT